MPGGLDGWLGEKHLLCQNKLAVSGDAQVVFLLFVHDDDLAVALKQVIAFDARLFAGGRRDASHDRSFGSEIHKHFSHRIS
jgi:hypothetical protein